jgi:hypothetical protein
LPANLLSAPFPQNVESIECRSDSGRMRYSICTIVTDLVQYRRMVDGFVERGFGAQECEYLYVDNSAGNRLDSYAGYNLFLQTARGAFIVLCHQDIELLSDGRDRLDQIIAELEALSPCWGLFGNCGGVRLGKLSIRISDPNMDNASVNGPFPAQCKTLDENFIVVRRQANLALPRDRSGFHFYGTELCLVAEILGWKAYVVDFHLRHHGAGTFDRVFKEQLHLMVTKYESVLRPRWISTPCVDVFLSASPLLNRLLNRKGPFLAARRIADLHERYREWRRSSVTSSGTECVPVPKPAVKPGA